MRIIPKNDRCELGATLILCSSFLLSSCSNSSIYSPWDTTKEKIKNGGVYYYIPRNCLAYPTIVKSSKGEEQNSFILELLWPTTSCRTRQNYSQFRVNGYGNIIYILADHLVGVDADHAFLRNLVSAINPGKFMNRSEVIPEAISKNGSERVYKTDGAKGVAAAPFVFADIEKKYLIFCTPRPAHASLPNANGGCTLQYVSGRQFVQVDFNPDLFSQRVLIFDRIKSKFQSFKGD